MRLLYSLKKQECIDGNYFDIQGSDFIVHEFRPTLFNCYLHGENRNIKTFLARMFFQTVTFGKSKIFYVTNDDDKIMHTSYVIPGCFKFPFMQKGDYEIGPCFTYPEFRGKGIYPRMLRYICANVGNERTIFFMIVSRNNISSIRGIEKAGFNKFGFVEKSRILKRYLLKQDYSD